MLNEQLNAAVAKPSQANQAHLMAREFEQKPASARLKAAKFGSQLDLSELLPCWQAYLQLGSVAEVHPCIALRHQKSIEGRIDSELEENKLEESELDLALHLHSFHLLLVE